jgi:hypothetical protein
MTASWRDKNGCKSRTHSPILERAGDTAEKGDDAHHPVPHHLHEAMLCGKVVGFGSLSSPVKILPRILG